MSKIHLVDGTYELFRSFFGAPPQTAPDGREVGATLGFGRSLLALVRDAAVTHLACAFDHVIESFRNQLFPGYKTGQGIDEKLLAQFDLAERMARACGSVVWSMVEFEADDALATAAARWRSHPEVEQIVICSPDKDLAQCVCGKKVVCLNRRSGLVLDTAGVAGKFGVEPSSIPDYLALVGDSADGIPGVPGWGPKSASTLLASYGRIESIPKRHFDWSVQVRGAERLAESLRNHGDAVQLYRLLATLRLDVPLPEELDDLRWQGARQEELRELCEELGDEEFIDSVPKWR